MYEDPIAIVGAASRLPGADSLAKFWELLSSGRDAVTEIPDGRWSKEFYFHPDPTERGKAYTWAAGIIDGIDQFDASFFGISPREADQIDPQQRLLLELMWRALEDAGIPTSKIAGSGCGVYIGASSADYGDMRMGDPASGDAYFMTGVTVSILANRLSYIYDLHGPSFTVDTACSSSLVALDLACKAIHEKRVPMAVVGGISLLLSPYPYIGFCRASMLSPSGRCFAFDARANGYVRAEGGGLVVLKPLSQALADGDHVRAVIRGTGVNSDGRTTGLSLPNGAAQARLLKSVYGDSGVSPDALSFIEAHGTGTQAGDPIEVTAIGKEIAQRRKQPLPIGSVKTNIGHLEAASGMAGLLKTMLALENRMLPQSLHFENPNPAIAFDELNIDVASKALSLPDGGATLLAGVNSFGFGGTNGHAILASAPKTARRTESGASSTLPPLLISARSEAALKELAGSWSHALADAPPEAAVPLLRGAARHRDQDKHRMVVLGESPIEISDKLDAFAATGHATSVALGSALPSGKLAFVYSGNGVQRAGMARDAMSRSKIFRDTLTELNKTLQPLLGWSVTDRLMKDEDPAVVARTDIAQPLLFAVQVGVTAALLDAGVKPSAFVGHSVGEIAAGWASGALSLAEACKIIVIRSEQQQRTQGAGGMAALGTSVEKAAELLDALDCGLEIAAINSSAIVTIAGPKAALPRLEEAAKGREWRYTRLGLDYAFHSAALDPIRDDLIAQLGDVGGKGSKGRFVSTVTGSPLDGTELDGEYWWRNIRDPVQFKAAIDHMIADGNRIFVEIGPNPALLAHVRDGLRIADIPGRAIGSLTHTGVDHDPFPSIAGECHVAGHSIAQAPIFDGPTEFKTIPAYPWQRERHWFNPTDEGIFIDIPRRDHPLLGFRRNPSIPVWSNILAIDKLPWLSDHAVEGVPVVPGAALVEMALAAARTTFPNAQCLEVTGVEIPRALVLEPGQSRELRVNLQEDGQLQISSRARLGEEPWSIHAVGRVAKGSAYVAKVAPAGTVSRVVDAETLYASAAKLGLAYGPSFRTVRQVNIVNEGEAVVALDTAIGGAIGDEFILNPALFDGALQGFFALLVDRMEIGPGESFIPSRFGRIRIFAPYGRPPASAKLVIRHAGVRSIAGSVTLFDIDGNRIGDADDCWFQRVRLNQASDLETQIFRFDRIAAPGPWDNISPEIDIAAAQAIDVPAEPTKDYRETVLLFDAYLASSAYDTIKPLAIRDVPVRIDDLVLSGAIAGESAPLLGWLLLMLERHGAATETDQGWRLAEESGLPDADIIWRTLIDDAPELTAELALAGGANLPRLLRSGFDGASPAGALIDQMLYGSPSGEQALAAFCKTTLNIAKAWPQGRPLRILEIGAGSGSLTRRLLSGLDGWQGTLTYVASDSDPHMVQRLSTVTGDYRGASAINWNPADGALKRDRQFDLIVSMYGITRLELDEAATARLYDTLAPGGILVAAEPEQNDVWNAIFGQTAKWWQGSLTSDFPASPIRGSTALSDLMTGSGFTGIGSLSVGEGLWPVTMQSGRRPASDSDEKIAGSVSAGSEVVLIAAGGDQVAINLARHLSDAGIANTTINPPEVADGAELCAALTQAGSETSHVVCLPSTGQSKALSADSASARIVAILTVARLVAETSEKACLWLVTTDAQGDAPAPAEAALWGVGRTISNELSQLDCRLVDFPTDWDAAKIADLLAHEIAAQDGEREVVWTDSGRHALRLQRGLPKSLTAAASTVLTIDYPGLLDTLTWKAVEREQPGPGQVQIEVHAAGLNFRDVMWAMALLPEEALMDGFSGPTLGLECTGVVSGLGAGVERFAIGDRVMALAPSALRSHVVTEAHAVAPLPDTLGFAAGATIPVAYLTVLYSLKTQARLEAGETILIHGGAGGVGLAAIQYAKHCGATIIATAGSTTKRAFLRHLGVDHILDSRDLAFADAVRDLTGGKGVDVVLNSLGGEAMERSLGLLRPFGRFVELGKRDFMMDTHVGLRVLRQNISYYAVDVDRLPIERPDLAAELLREVTELMERGDLRPLPFRTFPFAEAADAFRLMQGAGHLGKIVLTPDNRFVPSPVIPANFVHADKTYVVTGGLTGFGLETARWLVAKGARHIALLSRSGGGKDVLSTFAENIDVRAFACDVADASVLTATLANIRKNMPAICGVVHAAMVVDDGLVGNLTHNRIQRVLAPKLDGALNLDRLTRKDPIDLFLLFSSATTVMGAPGQGSYVAANMALEAIARGRVAEGLPALAVAWGPIGDVGYLAQQAAAKDALMRRLATAPMASHEALDSLPLLIASGEPVIAFAPVRWDAAHQYLPILKNPTFGDVVTEGTEIGGVDMRDRIHSLPPDEAKTFIISLLVEEAARVMSFAPDRIDPQRPLSEFGMDSLMAVELRLALEKRLGIDVPLVSLSDNTSLSTIATRMVRNLSKQEVANPMIETLMRHESAATEISDHPQPANPLSLALER